MAAAAASSPSIVSDCFAIQAPVASSGVFIGRNAYRSADEAVEVVYVAASTEAPATQKCSSIEVKGAPAYAVILNRPAGFWGADSGANEKKITVSVTWSKECADADEAKLTATDLTRLALERSASAEEAIATITSLVAEHNADDVHAVQQCFLVASEQSVWLLNVVGQLWASERITDGYRHIGAGLSIGKQATATSDQLHQRATDLAIYSAADDGPFDFASVFRTAESAAVQAGADDEETRSSPSSPFGLLDLFGLLRDTAGALADAHPCGLPPSASQVAALGVDGGGAAPVSCHWFTATPHPDESVYKPFVFTRNARISPLTQCDGQADGSTRLHRLHGQRNAAKVGVLLRTLEESCVQEVHNFLSAAEAPVQELDELLKDCVEAEVKFYR